MGGLPAAGRSLPLMPAVQVVLSRWHQSARRRPTMRHVLLREPVRRRQLDLLGLRQAELAGLGTGDGGARSGASR